MLYAVIFILILLMLITILLIKINVLLEYSRNLSDDELVLSFFIFRGMLKYKYEIPLIDLGKSGIKFKRVSEKGKKEEKTGEERGFAKFSKIFDQFKDIVNFYNANRDAICGIRAYLRTRMVFREFNMDVVLGAGDACYTGILTGIAWSFVGTVISFIENNYTLIKRSVKVKPEFNEIKLKVDLYCIFNIKIVYIIVVGLKLLPGIIRSKFNSKNNKTIGGDMCG